MTSTEPHGAEDRDAGPGVDPELLRETLGHYPTGVAVVTAIADDGRPAGMVVGSFSSISSNPALVAFCPTRASATFARLRTADAFCVNVLASDQESLCRRLATGGAAKFDAVPWRAAPLGSPILEGAVSWVECTFHDVLEGGDHHIVLGLVRHLDVERSTLPLLYFQGGYGQFSPRSLVAAPEPDLIQATRFAETIRPQVEALSEEVPADCSVLAKIGWDSVLVLAANGASASEAFALGHRQPIVAPLGAVYLVGSTAAEIEQWLDRSPHRGDEGRRELHRSVLGEVAERGYSLLSARPEVLQRHAAVVSEFERSGRLPRQERVVRQATSELAEHYGRDLRAEEHHELASVVVPVPAVEGLPRMAVRISGLPAAASTEQVRSWVRRLQQVAAEAVTTYHR